MARFLKDNSKKKGKPPGSLISIGDQKLENVTIRVTNFNGTTLEEFEVDRIEDCRSYSNDKSLVTWIDIAGLADSKMIESVGKLFGIHRLWLEDVLNTDHRPKVEEINDLLFVIAKSVSEKDELTVFEHVSFFLGDGFVISFQEYQGDTFNDVRERLRKSKWIIRQSGPDYLLYTLIDVVVDNYFFHLEKLGRRVESLEAQLVQTLTTQLPIKVAAYKNELLYLNKACLPVRDSLAHICRSHSKDINEGVQMYFKDAYEHSVQIVDTIESYRQMLSSVMDSYQSITNQKLNETMKILTIFATVFTPLTFIAGIYGMNFEKIPELKWDYGYEYALGLMFVVFIGIIVFIKKRKWL